MTADSTWLLRMDAEGDGPRLAVKDCIDVAGTPTTVACPAITDDAEPANLDAAVVATARQQGARIVGKTNLVELCRRIDGLNQWTGTPVNPLDPRRLPGGSSSGSAVAVARDEADVAYGTDTGGSIRVPAACCGIAGLKPTVRRLPTHGVFDFSRTLDTVGPMARDVAGLAVGMELMEPGFRSAAPDSFPFTVARVRVPDVEPGIDQAIDAVLAEAGFRITDVPLPDWDTWGRAADEIMTAEGYWAHRHLLDRPDRMERRHLRDIEAGATVPASRVAEARRIGLDARERVAEPLRRHTFLALPVLRFEPPLLEYQGRGMTALTVPLNLLGLPAVALPVPRSDGGFAASLQLVGSAYAEETLLAAAGVLEQAAATMR